MILKHTKDLFLHLLVFSMGQWWGENGNSLANMPVGEGRARYLVFRENGNSLANMLFLTIFLI